MDLLVGAANLDSPLTHRMSGLTLAGLKVSLCPVPGRMVNIGSGTLGHLSRFLRTAVNSNMLWKEGVKMPEDRIRVAPNTVAYADRENHKLVVEFAIPGAPTDTIDVKILEDSVHLTAPARDIEYVAALALGWPVKPDKAEAVYENGLLRIEVPFKDPMEDAVKVAIKPGGAETKVLSS